MKIFNAEKRTKFRELYEDYRDTMYWICYNIVKDEHDAEDCVHNSFMKISKIIDKIEIERVDRTKMLVIIIARNTAIDFYRKKKKMFDWEDIDKIEDLVDWKQVEDNIIDEYNYQCLLDEIDDLPENFRDILRLRYLFDLTIQEIAEQLSISETNVYARICRVKQLLWEAIENRKEP